MKSEDMEYGRMSTISGGMYIVAGKDGGCHFREAWPGVCSSVLQCAISGGIYIVARVVVDIIRGHLGVFHYFGCNVVAQEGGGHHLRVVW